MKAYSNTEYPSYMEFLEQMKFELVLLLKNKYVTYQDSSCKITKLRLADTALGASILVVLDNQKQFEVFRALKSHTLAFDEDTTKVLNEYSLLFDDGKLAYQHEVEEIEKDCKRRFKEFLEAQDLI